MAQEFERTGAGRLEYDRDTLEEDLMRFGAYGGHHIGTARMGNDRATSVVDRRLPRAFGATTCTSRAARCSRPPARPTRR